MNIFSRARSTAPTSPGWCSSSTLRCRLALASRRRQREARGRERRRRDARARVVSIRNVFEVVVEQLLEDLGYTAMNGRREPAQATSRSSARSSSSSWFRIVMSLVPGLAGATERHQHHDFTWALISFAVYNYVGIKTARLQLHQEVHGPLALRGRARRQALPRAGCWRRSSWSSRSPSTSRASWYVGRFVYAREHVRRPHRGGWFGSASSPSRSRRSSWVWGILVSIPAGLHLCAADHDLHPAWRSRTRSTSGHRDRNQSSGTIRPASTARQSFRKTGPTSIRPSEDSLRVRREIRETTRQPAGDRAHFKDTRKLTRIHSCKEKDKPVMRQVRQASPPLDPHRSRGAPRWRRNGRVRRRRLVPRSRASAPAWRSASRVSAAGSARA